MPASEISGKVVGCSARAVLISDGEMRFEFRTPGRIIFGRGTLSETGIAASRLGGKALVVTGSDGSRAASLLDSLSSNGVGYVTFQVRSEPTLDTARRGSMEARESGCDLVIGMGGGSALDLAKAVAMLHTNRGDPLDYIELIGLGRPIVYPSAPFVAIPTTAGSGSEATSNAVLYSPDHGIKASLRSPLMIPVLAVIDPDLSLSVPDRVTASTGMDALSQVIEPFLSRHANPLTDSVCREGMSRAARSLLRVFQDGSDLEARQDLTLASLCGGLALGNSGLGAVHGLASVIGGKYRAPHGAVCARLLPSVMRANLASLRSRMPTGEPMNRFDEIARILTGKPDAKAEDGIEWVDALGNELLIPPLMTYGLAEADFSDLVSQSLQSSSMKGNPVPLTNDELAGILAESR